MNVEFMCCGYFFHHNGCIEGPTLKEAGEWRYFNGCLQIKPLNRYVFEPAVEKFQEAYQAAVKALLEVAE